MGAVDSRPICQGQQIFRDSGAHPILRLAMCSVYSKNKMIEKPRNFALALLGNALQR